MVLWCFVLAWAIIRSFQNAGIDHEYAKQGLVSPRMQAKYGTDAESRVARYGLMDFLRDAYRDTMARRTDALVAARDAKAAERSSRVAATTVLDGRPKPSPRPRATRASTTPDPASPLPAEPSTPAPRVAPPSDGEVPHPAASRPPGAAAGSEPAAAPDAGDGLPIQAEPAIRPASPEVPAAGRHAAPDEPADAEEGGNVIPFPAQPGTRESVPAYLLPQADRERLRTELYGKCAHRSVRDGIDVYCDNPVGADGPYCADHIANTNAEEATMTSPTPALPTVPTGEATTIPQFLEQAKNIALHVAALKERLAAAIADLSKTVETFEASAAAIEVPAQLANKIAGAREAVAALAASQNGAMEEFNGAMLAVRAEFAQHMAGVEVSASTGGLAKAGAYQAG